jgi:hypothetical protein
MLHSGRSEMFIAYDDAHLFLRSEDQDVIEVYDSIWFPLLRTELKIPCCLSINVSPRMGRRDSGLIGSIRYSMGN